MSMLVVGSVALDSLETPFGVREDVPGGSATFFSTAASFFGPVQLVGVVGEDFPAEHVSFLQERGVDLEGLVRAPGRTFRWKGRYGFDLNEAQTLDTQLNVFGEFRPELPARFRRPDFLFLGNIHPELQGRVLDQVEARPRLVAMDTMNFWISGQREKLLEVLARVDLLFINDAEVRQLAGEHNVVKAARKILAMGPSRVVVKRGEYGAVLFEGDRIFAAPAWPLEEVFDPTGAGDSFAGGFMGYLANGSGDVDHESLRQACVAGSTLASFCVERFSLDRFRELSREEIRHRLEAFGSLTRFRELPATLR
ncbi:PfkB family carbohydrate kinase [Vulgatibacter incomptus]|uniref:Ribokinase n=1 Tax=Vulgatibacter incomptus TaxID=1391653 RepID=A0A0K1PCP4_9BACT|nr:PfkB family carbohydrate kinase [Vulgatibacter incomptus]AKU90889.1 Ribokinase [Vulgatibacter incomptus]